MGVVHVVAHLDEHAVVVEAWRRLTALEVIVVLRVAQVQLARDVDRVREAVDDHVLALWLRRFVVTLAAGETRRHDGGEE